jgi:hypothetical protein
MQSAQQAQQQAQQAEAAAAAAADFRGRLLQQPLHSSPFISPFHPHPHPLPHHQHLHHELFGGAGGQVRSGDKYIPAINLNSICGDFSNFGKCQNSQICKISCLN